MPDADPTPSHLSIGEVLALLLEEFPDVTISKIRFLESQGLIEPERTPSGYRKFYDADVELLRCILREQKDNFLPLRVIKDRLETGELDPTNETSRPRDAGADPTPAGGTLAESRSGHPASGRPRGTAAADFFAPTPHDDASGAGESGGAEEGADDGPYDAGAVCAAAGLTAGELEQLESYGVVSSRRGVYDGDAVEIARISKRFLELGVDARHLRGWRVAADREAGLFEQLIQPLVRQRNPEAREQAIARLTELERHGADLRAAMVRTVLRPHLEH